MPHQTRTDVRSDFTRRILPWLVAASMLLLYALTLNHWISLFSLGTIASLSGWTWIPQVTHPWYFLVTLPFRILPAAAVPFALNVFSAICAAAALGLLVRSAGLLSHDRTEAQASRLRTEFSLLSIRGDWFPPLLAAMICGLQLTFWQTATNTDSEIFDLLLFALVLWSLLEYRLDRRIWRLYFSAAIVGAGIADGPSMTGFFPLFIIALIWMRGLEFFNARFIGRMFLCGLAGFSLFLLLPLLAVFTGKTGLPFGILLHSTLELQLHTVKLYFLCLAHPTDYMENVTAPVLITLLPLLVMSVRWKFGDSSHVGSVLAAFMFHAIHAVFLCFCLWIVFDPPFSPRERGFGLTLYYLTSLSAAYYAGYFLLIFGQKHPRVRQISSALVTFSKRLVVGCVWALGILAVVGLAYKNGPLVHSDNGRALHQYASLMADCLPKEGAIVLSDDPQQLYLAQAALADRGRLHDYLLLDTSWLSYPQYHRYLHQRWPQRWPLLVKPDETNILNHLGLVYMMMMLSRSNQLCYLHPSFGYYFEQFYLEPHGLIYQMKPLPNNTLLPPPPAKAVVAANEQFWSAAQTGMLSSVESALAPRNEGTIKTFAQEQLDTLHVPDEPDINNLVVGTYCSRDLDFWGVELQQSGDLTDAAASFQSALRLNTNNVVAQINLDFNQELRAGRHPGMDPSRATAERLGKFDSLVDAMKVDGPFDEPNYCYDYAMTLVQDNGLFRQAAAPFERIRQLDPHFLSARMWLARIYGLNRLPDLLLDVLRAPMEHPGDFSVTEPDATQMEMLASAAYYQKGELARGTRLLEQVASRNSTNDQLLTSIEEIYLNRALYTNALALAEDRLSSTNSLDWLFAKGCADSHLGNYHEAISELTKVLAAHPDNRNVLFQRAGAYLGDGDLDAARADYEKLQQMQPDAPILAYNLGDIAWRQHDTQEAIRNYEIYLANAPTNTPGAITAAERLKQLQQPAGGK